MKTILSVVFAYIFVMAMIALHTRRFVPFRECFKRGNSGSPILLTLTVILALLIVKDINAPDSRYEIFIDFGCYFLGMIIGHMISGMRFIVNYKFQAKNRVFTYYHQEDKRWKSSINKKTHGTRRGGVMSVLAMIESASGGDGDETIIQLMNDHSFHPGLPSVYIMNYLEQRGIEAKYLNKYCDLKPELTGDNVICIVDTSADLFKSNALLLYEIKDDTAYIAAPGNFAATKKPITLERLTEKVNAISGMVSRPYISVSLARESKSIVGCEAAV